MRMIRGAVCRPFCASTWLLIWHFRLPARCRRPFVARAGLWLGVLRASVMRWSVMRWSAASPRPAELRQRFISKSRAAALPRCRTALLPASHLMA